MFFADVWLGRFNQSSHNTVIADLDGFVLDRDDAPAGAHPAFNRAADCFDLEVVRILVGDDLRADVEAMEEAIDSDTIALVGSAPCWPYGLIDPIPALADLALKRDLWCHVDACIGGFLLPFYRACDPGLEPMNLSVKGVTSISADLHKFGFTPHDISSVTFRSTEFASHATFAFDARPCGLYATDTFQGSRAGQTASSREQGSAG